MEGFEPSISRATIWRLRPLGYTRHTGESGFVAVSIITGKEAVFQREKRYLSLQLRVDIQTSLPLEIKSGLISEPGRRLNPF